MFHRAKKGASLFKSKNLEKGSDNEVSDDLNAGKENNDYQRRPLTGSQPIAKKSNSNPVMKESAIKEQQAKLKSKLDNSAQNKFFDPNNAANKNSTNSYAMPQKTAENTQGKVLGTDTLNQKREINTSQPIKENRTMNKPQENAQTQGDAQDNQNRVAIPGNNFSRPGQAPTQPMGQPAAPANRPAYPGNYPGATQPTAPAQQTSAYSAQTSSADDARKLIIGRGITMSGEIESCDHLIVEGTIEASLKGANVLDVTETGSYFGTVEIEEANIAGRFEGDITVRGRLTIQSTGVIVGSVSYKELAIEAGATLDGSVSPIGSQNAAQSTSAKRAPSKAKKAQNNDAELPFSQKAG